MANIDLRKIPKVCHSLGGLKSIKLTYKSNVKFDNGIPEVIDPNLEFEIITKRSSARYTEASQDSQAGGYISQDLKFFVPQKRFDIDYIISQLINNRIHVIYTDHNQSGEILVNAKMSHKYDSGQRRSDSNGYTFEFKAKTKKKYRNLSGIGIEIPIGDDQDAGSDSGTISDPGSGGGNSTPPFYVKINPVQLDFNPSTDGNQSNLNKFVTGLDGYNYFIDHLGVAMRFNVFPRTHIQLTSDDFIGNTVTVPGVPLDPKDYYINLNCTQRTLSNSVGKNTFTRNGDVFTFYKLTSNSTVDIYF